MRACGLLFAAVIALGAAQPLPNSTDPAPSAAGQRTMLDGVRHTAARYQAELPDFVCTLLTRRSEDNSGKGKKYKLRDTDEVEFRYVGRVAERTTLKVNNKPAHYEIKTGFRSDGVLPVVGFLPEWLLGPSAKTQFTWDRWETLNGRRAAVFALHLKAADSQLPFSNIYGSAMVGLDGAMFVDPQSNMVLRLELKLEIPRDSPLDVAESSFDLDYGPVSISGERFFLPVRTVVEMRTDSGARARNETEVVRYQKYSADSSVTFGDSGR